VRMRAPARSSGVFLRGRKKILREGLEDVLHYVKRSDDRILSCVEVLKWDSGVIQSKVFSSLLEPNVTPLSLSLRTFWAGD
jgi:hypothetical protein